MDGLMDFILNSEKKLKEMNPSLEIEKQKLLDYLQENFLKKSSLKGALLQGRVKNDSSLREKIIRKRYYEKYSNEIEFINNLPDLIGIRLVCLLNNEEKILFDELKKCFSEKADVKFYNIYGHKTKQQYIEINLTDKQPEEQKNGKEIYRIGCRWKTANGDYINVELQIKSLVHMFWGEIEHMVFYKNYSYIVGNDFYSNIMNSMYDMLSSIDSQLEVMRNQMIYKDETQQIKEIKQMLAKLIYTNCRETFKKIFKCEVDLREIYDVIIELHFQGTNTIEQALYKANDIISKLNSRSLIINEETFNFQEYNKSRFNASKYYRMFGITISELANSSDVYWKALVGLYMRLFSKENFTETINEISTKFINIFNKVNDFIEFEDSMSYQILKEGILLGIIEGFNENKKIDFFLPLHYEETINTIIDFIEEHRDDFDYDESEIGHLKEEFIEYVSYFIKALILSSLKKNVDSKKLQEIKIKIESSELPWRPHIDVDKLDEAINSKLDMEHFDFINMFKNLSESR